MQANYCHHAPPVTCAHLFWMWRRSISPSFVNILLLYLLHLCFSCLPIYLLAQCGVWRLERSWGNCVFLCITGQHLQHVHVCSMGLLAIKMCMGRGSVYLVVVEMHSCSSQPLYFQLHICILECACMHACSCRWSTYTHNITYTVDCKNFMLRIIWKILLYLIFWLMTLAIYACLFIHVFIIIFMACVNNKSFPIYSICTPLILLAVCTVNWYTHCFPFLPCTCSWTMFFTVITQPINNCSKWQRKGAYWSSLVCVCVCVCKFVCNTSQSVHNIWFSVSATVLDDNHMHNIVDIWKSYHYCCFNHSSHRLHNIVYSASRQDSKFFDFELKCL